jgi:hypothetical protein
MQRRRFIATLASAVALPALNVGAMSAQQADKIRRIGALLGWSQSDPEDRSFLAAFIEELARLGWVDGRNTHVEQRWAGADRKRMDANSLLEMVRAASLAGPTSGMQYTISFLTMRKLRYFISRATVISTKQAVSCVVATAIPGMTGSHCMT